MGRRVLQGPPTAAELNDRTAGPEGPAYGYLLRPGMILFVISCFVGPTGPGVLGMT